jgi:hypothetical protein
VKFYDAGSVRSVLRERFTKEVGRITWAYKLAETTINLSGSSEVPEIQVFEIDAKGTDVSDQVLAAIDKAVRTPILFEIRHGKEDERETRMTATLKRVGSGTSKVGAYYTTSWQPAGTERRPLPASLTLASLYSLLMEPLTPLKTRPGEGLSDLAARLDAVGRLEREVASLERKFRAEPQLNRKVALRRELKDRRAALARLM